jgi:protein-S-isoprenylcysteine O-methyltransferase Ste14
LSRSCGFHYDARVTLLGWLAAVVLFLQLPIPLYWFVLHPQVFFWRRHRRAAYITGLLCSWLPVTIAMIAYRRELVRSDRPPAAEVGIGLLLIAFEIWIFVRVNRDLGGARLVGVTELSGGGEIELRGIYGRIRHPRYAGSFLAILGACCVAGTRTTWVVAAVWSALIFLAIAMEEREMRARFGSAYQNYCEHVPRFLPFSRKVGSNLRLKRL